MSAKRKCYYCAADLKPMPAPMSEPALALAGQDFGLGDMGVPPEKCPKCGMNQPAPEPAREEQKPETD